MTEKDSTVNKPTDKIVSGNLQDLIPLLDWKEGKNAQNESTGNTILHVLIESFREGKLPEEQAVPLIHSYVNQRGVELNIQNKAGNTPMHILVQPASLAKEANALGAEGTESLERRAIAEQKILQEFLNSGADTTKKNNKGKSVLDLVKDQPSLNKIIYQTDLDAIKESYHHLHKSHGKNGAAADLVPPGNRQKKLRGKSGIGI